jgi:hypothetical protein
MKRIVLALVAVMTLGLGGLFASEANAQWGRRGGVSVNVGGWGGYRGGYYGGYRNYGYRPYYGGYRNYAYRPYWYGHRPYYYRPYAYGYHPYSYWYGRPGVYIRF